jgi:lysine-N-methylase
MCFQEGQCSTENDGAPPTDTESPDRFIVLNDLRAVIIFTLQHRALSLDTRLLLVGLFLESIDKQASTFDTKTIELLPQLTDDFCQLLLHGETIEQELRQLPSEDALCLKIFAEIMNTNPEGTSQRFSRCITEAAQGFLAQADTTLTPEEMVSRIKHVAKEQLAPFLKEHSHILENYLVHTVFHSLFPFKNEPLLQQYVKLVCHYLVIKTCLLGLTAFHGQMTEELVIQVIQSYSKLSEHNATYPARVLSILEKNGFTEFRKIFLLILDPKPVA